MNIAFATRLLAGPNGNPRPADAFRRPSPKWRGLRVFAAGVAVTMLTACADVGSGPISGEPTNGCMLAAINERAVLRAKNYMQPNVEAHLLAIWFQDSRHVALVVKGDNHWFAWDDAYGGRPLFLNDARKLPNPITAAHAAFPSKNVELAWWAD